MVRGRVYPLMASPRIFPGQTVEAKLRLAEDSQTDGAQANVYLSYYGEDDERAAFESDVAKLKAGENTRLSFTVPALPGPVFSAGVRVQGPARGVCLEALKWWGAPTYRLERPAHRGTMWRHAWVNGVDLLTRGTEMFRLVQNRGIGLLLQGTREWRDYSLTANVTPHLVRRAGIAVRAQGLKRFYGLLLAPGNRVQLVRMVHNEELLAEERFEWQLGDTRVLTLQAHGERLLGKVGRAGFDRGDRRSPGLRSPSAWSSRREGSASIGSRSLASTRVWPTRLKAMRALRQWESGPATPGAGFWPDRRFELRLGRLDEANVPA